jgi:uncharacterized protein YuzE
MDEATSEPTIIHDPDTGYFYIKLIPGYTYSEKKITVNIVIHLNENGNIIGIKLLELGADIPYQYLSSHFNVAQDDIDAIKTLLAYKS